MKKKPVILDYAAEMREGINPLCYYDFKKSLNIVTIGNKSIPLIDSDSNLTIEMVTRTKVVNESSDYHDYSLEFMTKNTHH